MKYKYIHVYIYVANLLFLRYCPHTTFPMHLQQWNSTPVQYIYINIWKSSQRIEPTGYRIGNKC